MSKRVFVHLLPAFIAFTAAAVAGARQPQPPEYDLIIRGGIVVDGTGAARFRADVGIRGDRIARVDRDGIQAARGREVLQADGLIVAPGFIDHHAHIATNIHEYPLAENFTRQGITTILASLHSGDQPYPLAQYMSALRVAPNVGFFAGHSWVRTKVLGLENRQPNPEELEQMKTLVDEAMNDGALGLSTGLLYVPANFAKIEEVIELARAAARHGGIYVSHMRDEASGLLDSVAETIRIGREARLPVQVQHHKAVGKPQWGWSVKSLAMIDAARAEGIDVTLDMYPYTASSTSSSVLFPQWALAGGRDAFAKRLADASTRARIESEMREIFEKERGGDDLALIQIRTLPSDRRYNGKTLADVARDRGLPNTAATGIQLAIELQLPGGFSAIYHSMHEDDVVRIMKHPLTMFDTDGDPVGYGMGHPHPRSYGTFPRVLGRYVREQKVLTLEAAIKKMTSMSADQIGQRERGRVVEGSFADITIFDANTIQDRATYTDPHQYPMGIHHVVVNGVPIIRNGALTGALPGRALKGPARMNGQREPSEGRGEAGKKDPGKDPMSATAPQEGKRTAHGLVYDRAGAGGTVVFIHGAILNRRQWDHEFARLRDRFDVVRYDQRAHGDSALPSEPFSPVDDLVALFDELKIARATIVGLSSGAQIALDAALAHPDRVERLVLAGPAISGYVPRERQAFATDLSAALKAGDYSRATEVLLGTPVYWVPDASRDHVRTMLASNERIWRLDPRVVRQASKPAIERLEEVKVPTLVLVGSRDVPDSLEQAEILATRVPKATMVSVADGGHLLNLTSPDIFEQAVRDFLEHDKGAPVK